MKNIINTKNLWTVFACILFVLGCDKDNDPDIDLLDCFITNVARTSTDYESNVTIGYSADNKITTFVVSYTEIGQTEITTYTPTYDGPGNISKFEGSDGSRTEFTYDANNRVTREDVYQGTDLVTRTEYQYNSSGQFIKGDYYYSFSGVLTKADYTTYEYANTTTTNPLRSRSFSGSGSSYGSSEFEYDDKKTPYAELGMPLVLGGDAAAATNNVTKRTGKSNSGTTESTTTYVYQYNDNGYPTQLTQKISFPSVSNTYTDTETYTYDCK